MKQILLKPRAAATSPACSLVRGGRLLLPLWKSSPEFVPSPTEPRVPVLLRVCRRACPGAGTAASSLGAKGKEARKGAEGGGGENETGWEGGQALSTEAPVISEQRAK